MLSASACWPTGRPCPPVKCAPWCVTSRNGHANAMHREDQWCGSEQVRVTMSRAELVELCDRSWREDYIVVSARKEAGEERPHVLLGRGEGAEWELTSAQAVRVAAALLNAVTMTDCLTEIVSP